MKHSKVLLYTPIIKSVLTYGPGPAGRFGGGWNYKIGVQANRRAILISLLIADLRIDWTGWPQHPTADTITRTDTPLGESLTTRSRKEPVA